MAFLGEQRERALARGEIDPTRRDAAAQELLGPLEIVLGERTEGSRSLEPGPREPGIRGALE